MPKSAKRTTSSGKKFYSVRTSASGKFLDTKRNSKSDAIIERTVKRFSGAMKRLAKS